MADYRIETLEAARISEADLGDLADLLADAVDSGSAVSFLMPLAKSDAHAWWRKQLAAAHPKAVFLAARDGEGRIVGTVQLQPAWAPNQPHRADVCKMIVHRRARGGGLGRRLMNEIERVAWDAGFTLLVLDTKKGCAAERLYATSGWSRVGDIPCFALDPDGITPHATVFFYKDLRRGREKTLDVGAIRLRPTVRGDLNALYAMQADPEASAMAGVKPRTREAFDATWVGIFANAKIIPRTIEWHRDSAGESASPEIVGIVNVFQVEALSMVGYTVARRHWGKGIATRALRMFLDEVTQRPLIADAAADNAGSIRVLERCGFRRVSEYMGEETDRYIAGPIVRFEIR